MKLSPLALVLTALLVLTAPALPKMEMKSKIGLFEQSGNELAIGAESGGEGLCRGRAGVYIQMNDEHVINFVRHSCLSAYQVDKIIAALQEAKATAAKFREME